MIPLLPIDRPPLDPRCLSDCTSRQCDAHRDCNALQYLRRAEVEQRLVEIGVWLADRGGASIEELVEAILLQPPPAHPASPFTRLDGRSDQELGGHRQVLSAEDRTYLTWAFVRLVVAALTRRHPLFRRRGSVWFVDPDATGSGDTAELARRIRAVRADPERRHRRERLRAFAAALGRRVVTLPEIVRALGTEPGDPAWGRELDAVAAALRSEPALQPVLVDPRTGNPWAVCRPDAIPEPPPQNRQRPVEPDNPAPPPFAWLLRPTHAHAARTARTDQAAGSTGEPGAEREDDGDESEERDEEAPSRKRPLARVVLRRSHLLYGFLPLAGEDLALFPNQPARVALRLQAGDGDLTWPIWLDNAQGVLYGLEEYLFLADHPFGIVLGFEPLERPGNYVVRAVDHDELVARYDAAGGLLPPRPGRRPARLVDDTQLWSPLLAEIERLGERVDDIADGLARLMARAKANAQEDA